MTEKLKDFLFCSILIILGAMVGFHILPYFFYNRWMDISLETGIDIGRSSVIKELKNGSCIVRENQVLFYPDSNSTFYFTLKRGD